jgi:hypothetical protein
MYQRSSPRIVMGLAGNRQCCTARKGFTEQRTFVRHRCDREVADIFTTAVPKRWQRFGIFGVRWGTGDIGFQ